MNQETRWRRKNDELAKFQERTEGIITSRNAKRYRALRDAGIKVRKKSQKKHEQMLEAVVGSRGDYHSRLSKFFKRQRNETESEYAARMDKWYGRKPRSAKERKETHAQKHANRARSYRARLTGKRKREYQAKALERAKKSRQKRKKLAAAKALEEKRKHGYAPPAWIDRTKLTGRKPNAQNGGSK